MKKHLLLFALLFSMSNVFCQADIEIINSDNSLTYTAGQTRIYSIKVKNNGPNIATDVDVHDLVPSGVSQAAVSWSGTNGSSGTGDLNDLIPTLNVGQTVIYTMNVNVPSGFSQTSNLVNAVTYTSTSLDPTTVCAQCTDIDTPSPFADIETIITDNETQFYLNAFANYVITVKNNGPSDAVNVAVSDPMPVGIVVMNWTGSNGVSGIGALTDVIANLPVGGVITYNVAVKVPQVYVFPDPINPTTNIVNLINKVTVTSSTPDPIYFCSGCTDIDTPRPKYVTVNTTQYTINQLVNDVLINSPCAVITGISTNFPDGAGYFNRENTDFPIKEGIVLRSGPAIGCVKTGTDILNNLDAGSGTSLIDPDLELFYDTNPSTRFVKDVTYVQFNFTPTANNFSFDFLFSAYEYGFYQCGYADPFAFILTDLTNGTKQNLAVVPNTTTPITVFTIRDHNYNTGCPSANANYFGQYNSNTCTTCAPGVDVSSNFADADINMMGQTKRLTASATVVPYHNYSIKLVIGDFSDTAYDSAVFIAAGSFNFGPLITGTGPYLNAQEDLLLCEGESQFIQAATADDPNVTYSWTHNGVPMPNSDSYIIEIDEPGVYEVTFHYNNSGCYDTDSIEIKYEDATSYGLPVLLKACENNVKFDLTKNEAPVLNGISPAYYTFTYYTSKFNAKNEIAPILDPVNYVPPVGTIYPMEIFMRIVDNNNSSVSCVPIKSFFIDLSTPASGTFDYGVAPFCLGDTTPRAVLNTTLTPSIGTFSSPDGLPVHPVTGEINFGSTVAGTYHVTYSFPQVEGCVNPPDPTVTVVIASCGCANDIIGPICEGDSFSLNGPTLPGATQYEWTGPGDPPDQQNNNNFTYPTGLTPPFIYTLNVKDATSVLCTKTVTVNVNPLPVITGTFSLCEGSTVTLSSVDTPASSNAWVSSNPLVATIASSGVVTGVSQGTADITFTNNNGCKSKVTVTINALPVITGTLVTCEGTTTTLSSVDTPASSNAWVSSNPSVATVTSLGVVTGVSQGTADITFTNSDGCKSKATVTINALPVITGTLSMCEGTTTTLSSLDAPATSNAWVSSNPSVATITSLGVVTGVSQGTTDITFTNSNGCKATSTVTINALPVITGTLVTCVGTTTTLSSVATPASSNAWVSSNSLVATITSSGVVTGVSSGTSVITFTNDKGCEATITVTISSVVQNITGVLNACVGATTQLQNASSTSSSTWTSSDSSIATVSNTGLVTGVSPGMATITFFNGCPITATVTINALPVIVGSLSACVGATTTLSCVDTPASSNAWVSSNPLVAIITSSGVVTGVSQGTTDITFTNNNGCKSKVTVTINALPVITGTLVTCVGTTTTLSSVATPATINAWVSSNPSVSTVTDSGVVTGVSQGTADITFTNSNGCKSKATVTINALPVITGTLVTCVGTTTTLSSLDAPATNNAWVSSNPLVATITSLGVVTGVSHGTTDITFTNSNGCKAISTVTINALPTITGNFSVCVGFTSNLSTIDTPATSNAWVSSNPSVATVDNAGIVTGVTSGTSIITFTNINGCKKSETIVVNSSPILIINHPSAVCFPNVVDLTAAAITAGSDAGTLSYWTNSTVTTSLNNPTSVAIGGTYYIKLSSSNGCSTIKSVIVTIDQLPVVSLPNDAHLCIDINGNPTTVTSLPTGLSTALYNFKWYNDTTGTSVLLSETGNTLSPVTALGTYRVEVENKNTGCKKEASATVVSSLPPSDIQFTTSSYFADQGIVTVNVSPVGDYEYQIDNGLFQNSNQFSGLTAGTHTIVVRDRFSCGEKTVDVRLIDFDYFFTPNGDGYNDRWNISDLKDQPNAKIYIFDRYGKLMKQITTAGEGWDGTFNKTPLPANDYWFTIEYQEQGVTKIFKSHFALKR